MEKDVSRKSEYYEKYWTPAGFRPHGRMWPELEALYERLLPRNGRALDLGCGDGQTSGMWLHQRGLDYLGLDVSGAALQLAAEFGLRTLRTDFDSPLPFSDDEFDIVVCIEVLEHLFAPLDLVVEAVRVLRPGGVFVCTTPNVVYWRNRVNLLAGRFDPLGDCLSHEEPWRDPHIRFFSPKTLGRMLTKAGLGSVVVEGQRGGVLNDLPMIGKRRGYRASSRMYGYAQERMPSLFGYCLAASALKL